ncbi:uncharacterized protein Eint_081845 [Encephalitozoon intestinalis ATCC 50506]|uniref:Uncharacterized protein n=1 Tax=Encephalitozoon intestinalis (strain ATCC 50506) TaxID=876142 RepID=W8PKJ7_ENCIT|nr:uncharacterized protein Eint_081845 [Encephalitozoon intestinalis ATCC 50506]AHL30145.1 hypothetical protein Eint_081845 [Encephalitozoon intestinalis ATCC 50506]UTX45908.1 hypothetical protein GPK93_08g14880 [Encephalitozoon intestinalis]
MKLGKIGLSSFLVSIRMLGKISASGGGDPTRNLLRPLFNQAVSEKAEQVVQGANQLKDEMIKEGGGGSGEGNED